MPRGGTLRQKAGVYFWYVLNEQVRQQVLPLLRKRTVRTNLAVEIDVTDVV